MRTGCLLDPEPTRSKAQAGALVAPAPKFMTPGPALPAAAARSGAAALCSLCMRGRPPRRGFARPRMNGLAAHGQAPAAVTACPCRWTRAQAGGCWMARWRRHEPAGRRAGGRSARGGVLFVLRRSPARGPAVRLTMRIHLYVIVLPLPGTASRPHPGCRGASVARCRGGWRQAHAARIDPSSMKRP